MLILFLIISPAVIWQPYSPAKFECPDTEAVTNKDYLLFLSVRRGSIGATSPGDRTPRAAAGVQRHLSAFRSRDSRACGIARGNDRYRDDLSWAEIRLQCVTSIAARSKPGRPAELCSGTVSCS